MKQVNLLSLKELATAATLFIMLTGCLGGKYIRSSELNRFVKSYGFVPFNIPRDKDGVATLITFENKREAVIASAGDCFSLSELSIDTLNGSVPNYYYDLTTSDSLSFDPGKIFGDKVALNAAFKDSRIKSIRVEFGKVFEIRTTRLSVEKQIEKMKEGNVICLKRLVSKKNYLIERVLGAGELKVVFKNDNGQSVNLDAKVLSQINVGNQYVRNLNGASELHFSEPRLIGYRLWQIEGEYGMLNTKTDVKDISNDEILKLKSQ